MHLLLLIAEEIIVPFAASNSGHSRQIHRMRVTGNKSGAGPKTLVPGDKLTNH